MSNRFRALSLLCALLPGFAAAAETRTFALAADDIAATHGVVVEATTRDGKPALRVTAAPRPAPAPTATGAATGGRPGAGEAAGADRTLAVVAGSTLTNGRIEVELSGAPQAGAGAGARGFVGIAFRVGDDAQQFEAFYLRPTNGRADDQARRNHSTQYISFPGYPWQKLREESPAVYESYVDLEPGVWTRVRIDVEGSRARLYVHGAEQPTLLVNDLKQPVRAGAVGLWIGPGTEAYFRKLRITPAS
jgi:hypothetical protein